MSWFLLSNLKFKFRQNEKDIIVIFTNDATTNMNMINAKLSFNFFSLHKN